MRTKRIQIISWILQLIAAVILLQTLFFKFSAAPESVYIFTKLGIEPLGRIGSGLVELVAGACLLIPAAAAVGAGLALGTVSVAILAHLTQLGIEVMGDGGELFFLAVAVWVCCVGILCIRWQQAWQMAQRAWKAVFKRK